MALINQISNILGFGGEKPKFNKETKRSTLHNLSSVTGDPVIKRNQSILDETDSFSTNKYRSRVGSRYIDNKPK